MNLKLGEFTFKGRFNYRRCRPCLSPVTLRSNGRNNSKHCWPKNVGSYCVRLSVAKSLTGFKFFRSNSQQHPSTCNRVCKRTQHAALNNVGSCWPTKLRPFARGLMWIVKTYLGSLESMYLRKFRFAAFFSASTWKTEMKSKLLRLTWESL